MPLRCLDEADRNLDALELTTTEWSALIATNRHVRQLRMACHPSPVVLKTSRLGTPFFAHHALGGCASGDETPEHLHLKALAIAAARARLNGGSGGRGDDAGLRTVAHRRAGDAGESPRRGRGAMVAPSRRRDAPAAGALRGELVRGLWLFRSGGCAVDAAVPALRVRESLRAGLTIVDLSAPGFLDAVFDRRLCFGFPVGATAAMTVRGAVATCWGPDCPALTRGVTGVEIAFAGSRRVGDLAGIAGHSEVVAAIASLLPADPLRGHITVRRADATGVAGCFRCDRPLTRFAPRSRFAVAKAAVTITPAWAAMIGAQPGPAPVWSVVPVAPPPASA